ncbi:RES family NAD+ phosphorylase [Salmonella enterica]|nr:RES family NAD+ phosphorylase [Salmonella enterica]EDZ3347073.1 RES domain-containing protein [Salmonella enterica]
MSSFRINLMVKEHERRVDEVKSSVGVICVACNQKSYYFNTKNRDFYEEKVCLICSKAKLSGILLEDFLFTLTRKLRNHYELTKVNFPDTLSIKEVLKRFTYDNESVLDKLSILLCQADNAFFQLDGRYRSTVDEAFIEKCKNDAIKKWNEVANDLKHARRFTHIEASRFYESLIGSCVYRMENGEIFNSTLTTIGEGHTFFRARLVKDEFHRSSITSVPEKELSAPPNYFATNSRMSPPGISFMYTAGDHETAIAELRPYVNDVIAVGIFTNTRELNFFDFTLLDDMRYIDANILENPKKDQYFQNRYILRELHELISKPFRATDTSYIETQMFAETIRNYRKGIFDGIIFGSSQRDGGLNYVIFGESSNDQYISSSANNYHVAFDSNKKVTFYQVTKLDATSKEIG